MKLILKSSLHSSIERREIRDIWNGRRQLPIIDPIKFPQFLLAMTPSRVVITSPLEPLANDFVCDVSLPHSDKNFTFLGEETWRRAIFSPVIPGTCQNPLRSVREIFVETSDAKSTHELKLVHGSYLARENRIQRWFFKMLSKIST